jgi:hypothetical protein
MQQGQSVSLMSLPRVTDIYIQQCNFQDYDAAKSEAERTEEIRNR